MSTCCESRCSPVMRKHRRSAGQYTSKKDPLLKKELGINGFFKEGSWCLNLLYRGRCKPVAPSFIEFVYVLSINVARILRESYVLTLGPMIRTKGWSLGRFQRRAGKNGGIIPSTAALKRYR